MFSNWSKFSLLKIAKLKLQLIFSQNIKYYTVVSIILSRKLHPNHTHFFYDVQDALINLIGRQLGASQWFPWQHSMAMSLLSRSPDSRLALRYEAVYKV